MKTQICTILLLALTASPAYSHGGAVDAERCHRDTKAGTTHCHKAKVQEQTYVGQVVRVSDGDTIRVLADGQRLKIRLSEIDTPERRQAFGAKAKRALASLVAGKTVRVVPVTTDRYGRLVARIYVGDLDVNAEMVRQGYAWVYRRYSRDPALLELERQAKQDRRGLWQDSSPIPPWQWRKMSTR